MNQNVIKFNRCKLWTLPFGFDLPIYRVISIKKETLSSLFLCA